MSTVEEKIAACVAERSPPAALVRAALACLINPGETIMNADDRIKMADKILDKLLPEPRKRPDDFGGSRPFEDYDASDGGGG